MDNIKCKNQTSKGYHGESGVIKDYQGDLKVKFSGPFKLRISVILFLATFFLLSTPYFLFAVGVCKWDSNGVVVCNAPGTQGYRMCISTDGRNGAIIAWEDNRSSDDIYAQKLDSLGNCLWTPNGVPVVTASSIQEYPCIISDGRGGAIIAWVDWRDYNSIYAQRIDSLGNCLWTVNGVPVCTDSGGQENPCITTDGRGGAIIAWESYHGWPVPTGNQFGIYAQRVDSAGNVRWVVDGIAVAPDHDSLYQTEQQIISDGNSGAIICWQQAEDTTSSPDYDVYAQRVDSLGNIIWGDKGVAICSTQNANEFPLIINDDVNGAIITWSDKRNDNWDVYAQRLAGDGSIKWLTNGIGICVRDSAQQVNWTGGIVEDDCGGAIIAWNDWRNGNWDIFAQRLDSLGNCLWTADGIPVCVKPGSQTWLGVCSDLAGGAIITWQDTVPVDRNFWDIYCQRIDNNGNCVWQPGGLGVCTHDSTQQMPVIVSDNTVGGAIIAWYDTRDWSTWGDVYGQRVGDTLIVGTKEMTDDRYQMTDIKLEVHPNPFSEKTDIRYMIHDTGCMIKNISLKIYDVSGKVVKILANESTGSGIYRVFWDGTDSNNRPLPKGVYFCVLRKEKNIFVKKILFIK